jgi:hypothetical protein
MEPGISLVVTAWNKARKFAEHDRVVIGAIIAISILASSLVSSLLISSAITNSTELRCVSISPVSGGWECLVNNRNKVFIPKTY